MFERTVFSRSTNPGLDGTAHTFERLVISAGEDVCREHPAADRFEQDSQAFSREHFGDINQSCCIISFRLDPPAQLEQTGAETGAGAD